jgi:cytochrome c oxidase subunit 4
MSTHTATSGHNETRTYVLTLLTLLVLTAITVFAAGINFGSSSVNVIIALTIATIKASLVALIFMHLLHDKPVNGVILVAGFIFLGLFLGICFTDVSSRAAMEPADHRPPAGGPLTTKPVVPPKPAPAK